jgi:hypothetical protein
VEEEGIKNKTAVMEWKCTTGSKYYCNSTIQPLEYNI